MGSNGQRTVNYPQGRTHRACCSTPLATAARRQPRLAITEAVRHVTKANGTRQIRRRLRPAGAAYRSPTVPAGCHGAHPRRTASSATPTPPAGDQAMTVTFASRTSVPLRTEFGISAIASTCDTSCSRRSRVASPRVPRRTRSDQRRQDRRPACTARRFQQRPSHHRHFETRPETATPRSFPSSGRGQASLASCR